MSRAVRVPASSSGVELIVEPKPRFWPLRPRYATVRCLGEEYRTPLTMARDLAADAVAELEAGRVPDLRQIAWENNQW